VSTDHDDLLEDEIEHQVEKRAIEEKEQFWEEGGYETDEEESDESVRQGRSFSDQAAPVQKGTPREA